MGVLLCIGGQIACKTDGEIIMVEIKKELLSPCGLYCGVCAVYLAHSSNNLEFKKQLFPVFKQWGAKTIEDIACTGCMSDGIIFPFCRTCFIKKCIKDKNLEGCHQCKDFPCKIYEKWPSAAGKEVMLKEIPNWRELGTKQWVKNVEDQHRCSTCGEITYRGVNQCFNCQNKIKK